MNRFAKDEIPLSDDPAGMEGLLDEAILLRDEKVTWKGRPARLVVVRPAPAQDQSRPFAAEARVWLDEGGVPLAMEMGSASGSGRPCR